MPVVAQRRIVGITLVIGSIALAIVALRGPAFGEVQLVFGGALVFPAIVFAQTRRSIREGIYDAEVPATPSRKTTSEMTIWAAGRFLPVLGLAVVAATVYGDWGYYSALLGGLGAEKLLEAEWLRRQERAHGCRLLFAPSPLFQRPKSWRPWRWRRRGTTEPMFYADQQASAARQ